MASGWSWNMLPKRLLEDERFLDLHLTGRGLLLSLYLVADKHGIIPATPRALARLSGLHPDEVRGVAALHECGLVTAYEAGGRWFLELEGYVDDRPSEMRKAPETGWPQRHPEHIRTPSGQLPDWLRTPSGRHPDTVRAASGNHPDDHRSASNGGQSGRHPDAIRTPSGLDETRQDETRQRTPADVATPSRAPAREPRGGRSSLSPINGSGGTDPVPSEPPCTGGAPAAARVAAMADSAGAPSGRPVGGVQSPGVVGPGQGTRAMHPTPPGDSFSEARPINRPGWRDREAFATDDTPSTMLEPVADIASYQPMPAADSSWRGRGNGNRQSPLANVVNQAAAGVFRASPCWQEAGLVIPLMAFCGAAARWYTKRGEATDAHRYYLDTRQALDALCRHNVKPHLEKVALALDGGKVTKSTPLRYLQGALRAEDPAHHARGTV